MFFCLVSLLVFVQNCTGYAKVMGKEVFELIHSFETVMIACYLIGGRLDVT